MNGWEAFANIQETVDPETVKKKEAEEKIEREGKGICEYCGEEIFKSGASPGGGWTWESEFLVGFCVIAKANKHKPLVKWSPEEGVYNVEGG